MSRCWVRCRNCDHISQSVFQTRTAEEFFAANVSHLTLYCVRCGQPTPYAREYLCFNEPDGTTRTAADPPPLETIAMGSRRQ